MRNGKMPTWDIQTTREWHAGNCKLAIGPRGGRELRIESWRRNGKTQMWKTRPYDFRIPVKFGMRSYDAITPNNALLVHSASECALSSLQAELIAPLPCVITHDTLKVAIAAHLGNAGICVACEKNVPLRIVDIKPRGYVSLQHVSATAT